ncbi:Aste57867_11179 [Aphanomyces stellatus]|uniref:Aste57867_11179 protein n=1 Tax=Aphanomyces stellatus TaxID=120398 RepID=A0A485KSD8_9STRA|nr:hypothetical protein As57867_011137 [Aphanomyces stellatus]VFT88046.1 Aste57867_11179 [Aphanomyces stellatus]
MEEVADAAFCAVFGKRFLIFHASFRQIHLEMGNWICCGMASFERLQREQALKEGDVFERKSTLFGMIPTTDRIFLQLNAAGNRLEWRLRDEEVDVARTEAVHLSHVAKILPSGKADLILYASTGKKLLDVKAKQPEVRDLWVQTLVELLEVHGTSYSPAELKSLQGELEKQKARDKEEYWQERTLDMEKRVMIANEKKKAFANVGMRFTAMAMARR